VSARGADTISLAGGHRRRGEDCAMTRTLVRRDWIVAGLAAGSVSGLTSCLFAILAQFKAGQPPAAPFEFFASVVAGDQALGAAWAVPLGVAAVILAAIAWAFGYLYAAQRQGQLLRRPILSGIGFGVIVWLFMLALLIPVGKFHNPTIYTFDRDIVGFTLFFGIPLAYVATRLTHGGE
jgi:hypothetical protein